MKKVIILLIILISVVIAGFCIYFNQDFFKNSGALIYKDKDFNFELTLPPSWKGFTTEKKDWQGWTIDTGKQDYSGEEIIIKNPKTTDSQAYQDVPIMVFTKDVWQLVADEKVSVSAAPIGPQKIGENKNYVFATPPRWYGFTDAIGWEEAIKIIKTFKGL